MAYGGINKSVDAAAEIERNPVSRFSLNMEKQAVAGRDGRNRLARPNSQARTGTGKKKKIPCAADHEQDWQPIHVMTIHTTSIHRLDAFRFFFE